jgi:hypothetical protein
LDDSVIQAFVCRPVTCVNAQGGRMVARFAGKYVGKLGCAPSCCPDSTAR